MQATPSCSAAAFPGGALLLALGLTTTPLLAEVVINEIMYHPAHAEQTPEPFGEEFIELHNTDPANPVNLDGWSFTSGVTFTFPAVSIPAGGFLIVSADPAAFATRYPGVTATVVGPWTGRLGNDGEKIRISNFPGTQTDELSYTDDGDWADRRRGPLDYGHEGWIWASPADNGGSSLELVNPALSNKSGQNWAASSTPGGSPGAPNPAAASDIAPLISNVGHHPAIPSSSDLVRVRAELSDELPTGMAATVHYRVSDASPEAFTSLAMFDDGLHDDVLANDGIFAASLPAHADGTVIEFYVESSDGANFRTWPGPTDTMGTQEANALYAVEDNPPVTPQNTYRLVLSVPENNEFAFGAFNRDSNAQMNATFIATSGPDSAIRYRGGLRRRGNSSRSVTPRTMRLNLPLDNPWDGLTALNLNSRYTYLQIFGHKLFAASCLPSQEGRSVQLLINGANQASSDGTMYGSYSHMEPMKNAAITRLFPNDDGGNLYRSRRPDTQLAYRAGDVAAYLADGWSKETNNSDWDWTDLDALFGALNDTANPDYFTNVEAIVNLDQWTRWFAVMTLLNNGETNLSNGADDDYYLYRPNGDPRFQLIPHDLDTIVGLGDSSAITDPQHTIFDMFEGFDQIAVLESLVKHPRILPLYFGHLRDLIETSFSKTEFDTLVADCLGHIPQSQRNNIISHMDQRRAHVLSLVNPALSVQSGLPTSNGLPRTNYPDLALDGGYNIIDTASILVNGSPATLDPVNETWTFGPAAGVLNPGINRITVEALDANSGVLSTEFIAIWYDDGDTQALSGSLATNTTLDAAGGPWLVTADLTVPAGITLTIDPGTSVYFASGTRLTVQGTLLAEGTPFQPVRLTRDPATTAAWAGVYFSNTTTESRMTHLDQAFSTSGSQSLGIVSSRLTLTSVRWLGTDQKIIEASHPQLLLFDCEFPPTSGQEVIHGNNLTGSDYFHLDGCFFNSSSGYNDIIDFTGGRRPGPILYVTNNTFNGGTDDCLDLDGIDAHVEGNIFRNIHTDDPLRPSTSNAIATDGDAHITIVRNIFDDVDHALLLKNDADAIFENNVVINATLGAINFREPLRPEVLAGSHVDARGNIFLDNAVTFRFPDHLDSTGNPPVITADFNILPAAEHIYGTGNLDLDPAFVDPDNRDFRLRPGSPAIGTGIIGADMGAGIPYGALVTGAPPAVTSLNSATLDVHAAGISGLQSGSFLTEYQWRLDGAAWSAPTDIALPITLTGLGNGLHTVDVIAKDSAGFWQAEADATTVSWTVNPAHSVLRINEILADNETAHENFGTFPDYVELYNDGSTPVNLTGMRLTDDPLDPAKFIFPAINLPGGAHLLLYADDAVLLPGTHLGFALNKGGESLTLLAADGLTIIDSVTYGTQVADCSIGRTGPDAAWDLNSPTPNAPNIRKGTGSPSRITINEWLATSSITFGDDFVELYNADSNPVALDGLYFTDNPSVGKTESRIPPLSFIAAGGFQVFWADGNPAQGASHLSFKLNGDSEWIGLYDAGLALIDLVSFSSQVNDVSNGRFPDGSASIESFILPTAGLSNTRTGAATVVNTTLVAIDDVWSYEQSDTGLGTAWRNPGYVDAGWSTGPALLYVEDSALPGPKNTPLTLGASTYYFRKSFTFSGDPAQTDLFLRTIIDDGVVIYLNGQELHRLRIDDPYGHGTYSSGAAVGDAAIEGPFTPSGASLINGTNVIAAEVHQTNATSSDVVFGLILDASTTIPGTPSPEYETALDLMDGLRITEIMYDPLEGTDYEFIELRNVGTKTLDLTGVRLVDGIDFVFPAMTLAPGEYVLVVSDIASFQSKYGTGLPVAGEYTGKLSNDGEQVTLRLADPFLANIQKFTYNDAWYPLTDGNGYALEVIDPTGAVRDWTSPSGWQVGSFQGTPGDAVLLFAGPARTISLPGDASLAGTVNGPWSPTLTWSKVSGPGTVGFASPSSLSTTASFSLPGTYVLRLTGSDLAFTLMNDVTVTVDDTYGAWRARKGVAGGPMDNDDNDPLLNLVEYAFELDPFVADPAPFAPPFATPGEDGTEMAILSTLYPRKSDLAITLEGSADALAWSAIPPAFLSGTPDQELVLYAVPLGATPRQLFRFSVVLVP